MEKEKMITSNTEKYPKVLYIECACYANEHRVVITLYEDKELLISFTPPILPLHTRVWEALKYIFTRKWNVYNETLLNPKDSKKLKEWISNNV